MSVVDGAVSVTFDTVDSFPVTVHPEVFYSTQTTAISQILLK